MKHNFHIFLEVRADRRSQTLETCRYDKIDIYKETPLFGIRPSLPVHRKRERMLVV